MFDLSDNTVENQRFMKTILPRTWLIQKLHRLLYLHYAKPVNLTQRSFHNGQLVTKP